MPRIVSLVASATEIVHALGLGRFQVGRSHECDYPPEVLELPVCSRPRIDISGSSRDIDSQVKEHLASATSVYDVFGDRIDTLQPTHILTQTQCRVCAVSLADVESALSAERAGRPRVIALEPNSLAEVFRDIMRIAEACDVADRGRRLCSALQREMAGMAAQAESEPRKRVAMIEWIEPLMAGGNWVPELVELAGADDVFGAPGQHSAAISFDSLMAANPDAIVVAPCGFDLQRTRSEMHYLTDRPEWAQLKAVRSGAVFLVDGNQYMARPGPRLVDSLRILSEILHPSRFEPSLRGVAWEPV